MNVIPTDVGMYVESYCAPEEIESCFKLFILMSPTYDTHCVTMSVTLCSRMYVDIPN